MENTSNESVLIIGAGQAGVQVADSLRAEGFTGAVTILNDEAHSPYQRPPLSKDYLGPDPPPSRCRCAGPAFFEAKDITLLAAAAVSVDTEARSVTLSGGTSLGYTHLVLATGAANRPLPCPGADLEGVHALRTLTDAKRLQDSLSHRPEGGGDRGRFHRPGIRRRGQGPRAGGHGAGVRPAPHGPRTLGHGLRLVHHTAPPGRDRPAPERGRGGNPPRRRRPVRGIHHGTRHPADLVLYGVGVNPRTALAACRGTGGGERDRG